MFLEYDWAFGVYRVRFGQTFTDWRGIRSFESLADAKAELARAGCRLGKKTDSRTWSIEAIATEQGNESNV
jgi:hypothetical protein